MLLCLMAVSFTYVQLQEARVAWDYPIKSGTEKWNSMESHDEMLDACQIQSYVESFKN